MVPTPDSGSKPLGGVLALGVSDSKTWRLALDRVVRASWDSVVAFVAPLLLFLATMAPTIYNLDSAEFTTAAYTGGLVRATGYPLYLLVGRIWSRLPIGDVGYRMNLLSVVCGALTIALAYRVLRRLEVGGWAAFGALGLLVGSQYFWGLSLIAEVYTPHTALMTGILLLLLRFEEAPSPRRLAETTFLFGLSSGHHMATILMAPACFWFVLKTGGRDCLRARFLLPSGFTLMAGLSIYAYLPLVYLLEPIFNYAGSYGADGNFQAVDLTTVSGLWWLVSGQTFSGQMMAYNGTESIWQVGHLGTELWRAFVAIGVGPGLLGLVVLWRRHRSVAGLLLLMFLIHSGFYVNYAVGDKDTMFLPTYLIWALWLGVGYQWLLQWVGKHNPPRYLSSPATATVLLRLLMVCAVVLALLLNGPLVDQSSDRSSRRRAEMILALMEPGGILIGWWDTVPAIEYLQLVEGRGEDVTAINRFLIELPDLREMVSSRLGSQPIYLDEPPGKALPGVKGVRTGPLYRLIRSPGSSDDIGDQDETPM
jgi:hypothetical protein